MLGRHGACVPGMRGSDPAVVDQGEPLTFRVLEFERQAAVALADRLLGHAMLAQLLRSTIQSPLARDPERGADDRMRAASFARDRPVEEGEIGAGSRFPVGIEEMIGADIVLIDRLFHEPHAEHAGIEGVVARRIGRDGGEMVNAFELHGSLFPGRAWAVWSAQHPLQGAAQAPIFTARSHARPAARPHDAGRQMIDPPHLLILEEAGIREIGSRERHRVRSPEQLLFQGEGRDAEHAGADRRPPSRRAIWPWRRRASMSASRSSMLQAFAHEAKRLAALADRARRARSNRRACEPHRHALRAP